MNQVVSRGQSPVLIILWTWVGVCAHEGGHIYTVVRVSHLAKGTGTSPVCSRDVIKAELFVTSGIVPGLSQRPGCLFAHFKEQKEKHNREKR